MKKFLLFLMCIPIIGCSPVIYSGIYQMNLSKVEHPAENNLRYGETKIINLGNDSLQKYSYEDDVIKITWSIYRDQLEFNLLNKTIFSLKIIWDDVAYVDHSGKSNRVIHAGIKYAQRSEPQAPTTIAKGAFIDDLILPAENVFMTSIYSGWEKKSLVPSYAPEKEILLNDSKNYIGKTVKVVLPIQIEGTINEYAFTFDITGFTPYF